MATELQDKTGLTRRWFLLAGAAGLCCAMPAVAAMAAPQAALTFDIPRFVAAWKNGDAFHVGLLAKQGSLLQAAAGIEVPTRAHGLALETDGSMLAVARRPGDWMLRWHPGQREPVWVWAEPGRSFNGHVAISADGKRVFTSETDLDNGTGLIGVRDARTLDKLAEWRTGGIDPHALLIDGDSLLVANGGIPTQPETGRVKRDLEHMDSSLVRLDMDGGEMRGQWRLADRRLSLRHLARNGTLTGIALQAEHDAPAQRTVAPLLALFDGQALQLAPAPAPATPLQGYGGDIATCGSGFAVGAPRANCIAIWQPDSGWHRRMLEEGCALASTDGQTWAAGRDAAAGMRENQLRLQLPATLRIDNHWLAVPT